MGVVIAALLPVFLLIVLGFILKRSLMRLETQWHGLERLTYYMLFPMLLIQTLVKADLTKVPVAGVGGALFLSALAMALLCLALRPLLARLAIDGPAFTSLFQGAVRWQTYVALAVSSNLYGETGLALASAQTQRCVSAEPRQPRDRDRIPGAIVPTLPEPAMPMATWRSRRSGAPGAVLDDRDFPAGAHGCRRSCGCLCPRAVAGRASSPASRWWLLPRGTGTLRAMSCSCSPQGSDNPLEVDSRDPMGCGRRERCRRRS